MVNFGTHALRRKTESTMTRVANRVAAWGGIGFLSAAIVLSFGAATAWPEPLPDFRAYEAGPERKAEFFEYVGPIIAAENARVRRDRRRLIEIASKSELSWLDRWWLESLANEYRIEYESRNDEELLNVLLRRVDVVPVSLALAQAAKESGWGTSRFAREANNLFGEWCFDPGCGLVPQNRPEGRRHEVEAFETPRDSVVSYLRLLNTHDRYRDFRLERARLRKTGTEPSGLLLADELSQYSERRDEYVKDIKHMIRVNKLTDFPSKVSAYESTDAGG